MKVLIVGAGIGGCAAAIAFSQKNWQVTVIDKSRNIFTEGAGILLYSNALKTCQYLNVLDHVKIEGYAMLGKTKFYDHNSQLLGYVNYYPIDIQYPAYIGINRNQFLNILYKKSVDLGCVYHFNFNAEFDKDINFQLKINGPINFTNRDFDLIIAADGTNSRIRNLLWSDKQSKYSGYGLYHSMHQRHPLIDEKITVVMPDRRFGVIPMSNDQMYVWASLKEPIKRFIARSEQPKTMHDEFCQVSGFLSEIIEDIKSNIYVHYTAVEEVSVDSDWHTDNIVLLGDAAHASVPFMAQGGAMALEDAKVLVENVNTCSDIAVGLRSYKNLRKPVVDFVQKTSNAIGAGYQNDSIDLFTIEKNLKYFYNQSGFFK